MCDLDANDYAILLNSKLEILLDKHAPVKKRSVLVGQLSNEAIEAKKRCRRMERVYRRKRTGAAKQAYKSAKEAKLAILNSKASSIKEEFNSNANPCGAHFIEFCIVARNSTTLMLSANLSSLRSILFSSLKSLELELFKRQLKTHLFKIALDGEPRRL